MVFHEKVFLVFFAIVFPVYVLVKHNNRLMNIWLMIASYVFYGWWRPEYILLLFGTKGSDLFERVVLPIGISFHTFQSMSYTIDAYYGRIETERSFVRFLTFVSFFPQLVAGPIERASNLLPQLQRTPVITRQDVTDGASLFLVGYFKKVALADYLALYVDKVYDAPDS